MATITITTKQALPVTGQFTDSRALPAAPLKIKVSVSNPKVLEVVDTGDGGFEIRAKRTGESRVTMTSYSNGKMLRTWRIVRVVKPPAVDMRIA